MSLHIGTRLYLPVQAITQTFGILAVRGAGKSNLAAVMAEQMWKHHLPFVVIDPVGAWYGLRSSANGRSAGLPIPIFGGDHGDVPIDRHSGELIADLIIEKRLCCVVDLSAFESENDKKAFLLAFARRLYRRNKDPLHLFLEEADDYIPQKPIRDEAVLLRAFENIVRRGRSRGLGMTLITQRSAVLNKNVLTQVETLFVLRTTGPQDRKAIAAWVEYNQQSRELLSTLPGLKDGEAWVWSPQFLKVTKRYQIHRRTTFDSGATPKNVRSRQRRKPATVADIDISLLKKKLSAQIEKAKESDPNELRAQLRTLERENAAIRREIEKASKIQTVTPGLTPAELDRLRGIIGRCSDDVSQALATVGKTTAGAIKELRRFVDSLQISAVEQRPKIQTVVERVLTHGDTWAAPSGSMDNGTLPVGEAAILQAAIQHHPTGVTPQQVSVLTGYKRSSRNAYVSRLKHKRFLISENFRLIATSLGRSALPNAIPLPKGEELRQYWIKRLPFGEKKLFHCIVQAHPNGISRAELEVVTNYKRSSRDAYLARLRTKELITSTGGMVCASEHLF